MTICVLVLRGSELLLAGLLVLRIGVASMDRRAPNSSEYLTGVESLKDIRRRIDEVAKDAEIQWQREQQILKSEALCDGNGPWRESRKARRRGFEGYERPRNGRNDSGR